MNSSHINKKNIIKIDDHYKKRKPHIQNIQPTNRRI